MSFEKVIETVEEYIETQNTYFVLEDLDTLRKNGRLTGIKSLVAGALNIKPVMGATPEGDDPADRTGERHEARTGKDGRTGGGRCREYKDQDSCHRTL